MKMNLRKCRKILLYALGFNTALAIILYYFLSRRKSVSEFPPLFRNRHWSLEKDLTVVIREFEHYDNAVLQTVERFREVCPKCKILVISEKVPYPAITSETVNFDFIKLEFDPAKSYNYYRVLSLISTDYVLFVPDGAIILDGQSLINMIQTFKNIKHVHAIAVKVNTQDLSCPGLSVNLQNWQITITDFEGTEGMCDSVQGEHAILMRTEDLDQLPLPFKLPLAKSLYIQFVLRRWKTLVYKFPVFEKKIEFQHPHSQWKHKHLEEQRWSNFLHSIGIKYVHHIIDIDKEKHFYYGCTKETERCFGSVVNDVPDFIVQGKWTPPCCLKAIRETARHVFKILQKVKARYWLEGGSLLGAVRHRDIIPWDFDVDVGIYLEDVRKVPGLVKALRQPYVDEEGFVWEKAEEGEFYRVQYSEINRNHVDIFPFYSKNGTMTKNTWFKTHRQDTEFPELFLKPLTQIEFIGMNVSAPNHVKDFLEFKFGIGVIEHPKYTNEVNVY